ncbi:unnamed protein product [Meganyctiphanes norvegica]|uniref:C-type lectin domain-containing protein n=1 Tax=Meganyctiphanes norvegica TaxID=48144 RepID=A0AAV2RSJ3_MEGNR
MQWGVILVTATALVDTEAAADTSVFDSQKTPSVQNLVTIGLTNNDADFSKIPENEIVFDHGEAMTERRKKGCHPTILCDRIGGFCVKSRKDCKGTVDRYGCRGGKKCKCCIPDRTTAAPVTCPVDKCTPCPTSPITTTEGHTRNPNVDWDNIGSDWFVKIDQRVSWDEARALCQEQDLDLYQPIDPPAVARYLEDKYNDGLSRYWLGARGNGTHVVWISGDILSEDNPYFFPNPLGIIGACTILLTNSNYPEQGTVLYTNFSCRNDFITLCG